ncbi:MAG: hypothetical protein FD180_4125 [Planctomycetota bacterium]|nr:MAG: hypothetical protein FD180_4125 [Planctomycetota bacterium]
MALPRLLAALLLATVFALPVAAQGKATPYVDGENGIAMLPPDKWKCIPTPKEMKYKEWMPEQKLKMVAKWSAPQGDADNRPMDLEVYEIKEAKTVEAALQGYVDEKSSLGRSLEVLKQQDILIQGKHKGKFVLADPKNNGFGYTIAIVCNGEKSFALEFTGSLSRAEKAMPDRLKVVMTFQFLSAKDIEKIRKAGPKLLPGWQVNKTEHYDIQYNCDKEFAVVVGRHLEAILLEYQKFFPLDSFGGGPVVVEGKEKEAGSQKVTLERMTVKLFGKNEEFQSYALANGVGGAAAYFSPMQNELCGYKTVSQGKTLSIHIMYHEAMHQYLHALFGEEVRIPIWLNEGMAEYFFGGEFSDQTGRFTIGLNKVRIDTIRQACRDGSFIPLAKLFKYTQGQYYANPDLCYAEGWSIAYFMWTTPDAKYKGVIESFMKKLRQTKDADEAFDGTFGKLDMDQLEKDWKDYVVNKM